MANLAKSDLQAAAIRFTEEHQSNYLSEGVALQPGLVGMRMYGAPLLGIADAGDPLFAGLRASQAIGPHFLLPETWLPGARSVISFFSPLTEQVTEANLRDPADVPPEWLHARIEGQLFINALTEHLRDLLVEAGAPSMIPLMDERFWSNGKPALSKEDGTVVPGFTSNWSERHVAHVCGLGTFGLSRGLITKKGMAGRFGSIITAMPLEPDGRPYTRYDEYCTHCGSCIAKCPVKAITLETGKDQPACQHFCDEVLAKNAPRYGCGKCSVGVPCVRGIPS